MTRSAAARAMRPLIRANGSGSALRRVARAGLAPPTSGPPGAADAVGGVGVAIAPPRDRRT